MARFYMAGERLRTEELPFLSERDDSDFSALQRQTCCFTGHRVIPADEADALRARLLPVLERLYRDGWRCFWCGGAMGFDTLAAQCVLSLRDVHPDVRLQLALPCGTQTERWPEKDRALYEALKSRADEVRVLSPHYYNGCMMVRNRFMCDRSSLVISYLTAMRGGTLSTVSYAVQCRLPVLNLGVPGMAEAFVAEGPAVLDLRP